MNVVERAAISPSRTGLSYPIRSESQAREKNAWRRVADATLRGSRRIGLCDRPFEPSRQPCRGASRKERSHASVAPARRPQTSTPEWTSNRCPRTAWHQCTTHMRVTCRAVCTQRRRLLAHENDVPAFARTTPAELPRFHSGSDATAIGAATRGAKMAVAGYTDDPPWRKKSAHATRAVPRSAPLLRLPARQRDRARGINSRLTVEHERATF